MKVMLIAPYPYYAKGIEGVVYPPLGLLYLAAAVKKQGLAEVRTIDANMMRMSNGEVISEIVSYNPQIIGISSNIVTHRSAIELMKLIRQKGMTQLLLTGGPYPTLFLEKYLEYSDIVINGEGEETFCEILDAYKNKKDLFSLKGISYKNGNSIVRNENREFLKNLDEIPFPDYQSLKPELSYYSKHSRITRNIMAPILSSRGCPYQCVYCNKTVFGTKFRYRSSENVVAEIEWLGKNFKVDQIDILDDNFNLIVERAERILDEVIGKNLNIAISCHNGLRADKISNNLAKKLKKSGVFKVGLGIETADPELMKGIRKGLDLLKVRKAISVLRQQGIVVHGYFILGLPGDTPHSMKETIKFAKDANPHFCNFAVCIPFPGTEAYNKVKKEGKFLLDVDNGVSSGFFDGKVFFEIGDTKAEDVSFYVKQAYKEFYFNFKKILDILLSIKSFKEFVWLASTSFSVLTNMLYGLKRRKDED